MEESDGPGFVYDPPREPFLRVLHADRHVLIVGKPHGLLSVPGKDPGLEDSVATRARARFPEARIVHRLDLDTSGVMVLGLGAEAHRRLSMAFEARETEKRYIARVAGEVAGEAGRIDLPLAYDPARKPRQRVDPAGRPSVTLWEVVGREDGATRLALTPLTGRSHQLRVHLLALGHPILGDPLYAEGAARDAAPRLQLHAERLGFRHPGHRGAVSFTDPCPF